MTDPTKSRRKPGENRGGARPGSGRPKGSRDQVSIKNLLETLDTQAGGQNYEELTLKYHNLILNKVMNTLAKIEVTDSTDAIEAKQQAFADALSKLVGVKTD